MNIPEEFNEIRPYEEEEYSQVISTLQKDRELTESLRSAIGVIPTKLLLFKVRRAGSIHCLQRDVIVPLILKTLRHSRSVLSSDLSALPSVTGNWLFISNHRDIVMDSALLDCILIKNGGIGVEIAIGDNLLAKPWIQQSVKLNRSFIVRRSLPPVEFLEFSKTLSAYIRFAITTKQVPVWIAQREGRAKDSDDRTQKSLLKMLTMSDNSDIVESIRSLHLVPLSISYEYDPCDWLKAREFQLKRDNPDYRKSREEDLLNMKTGIFGHKGHVHYQAAECIDSQLDNIDRTRPKNAQLEQIAEIIDRSIHAGYMIYPGNRVALDLLHGDNSQSGLYTEKDKAVFEQYMESRLQKIDIPDPDWDFLRTKFLEMYANPLINQIKATAK